jgi:hypothetical protein
MSLPRDTAMSFSSGGGRGRVVRVRPSPGGRRGGGLEGWRISGSAVGIDRASSHVLSSSREGGRGGAGGGGGAGSTSLDATGWVRPRLVHNKN